MRLATAQSLSMVFKFAPVAAAASRSACLLIHTAVLHLYCQCLRATTGPMLSWKLVAMKPPNRVTVVAVPMRRGVNQEEREKKKRLFEFWSEVGYHRSCELCWFLWCQCGHCSWWRHAELSNWQLKVKFSHEKLTHVGNIYKINMTHPSIDAWARGAYMLEYSAWSNANPSKCVSTRLKRCRFLCNRMVVLSPHNVFRWSGDK